LKWIDRNRLSENGWLDWSNWIGLMILGLLGLGDGIGLAGLDWRIGLDWIGGIDWIGGLDWRIGLEDWIGEDY
jgi:hypothetical protein